VGFLSLEWARIHARVRLFFNIWRYGVQNGGNLFVSREDVNALRAERSEKQRGQCLFLHSEGKSALGRVRNLVSQGRVPLEGGLVGLPRCTTWKAGGKIGDEGQEAIFDLEVLVR
jgi:hypothetical protein